MTRRALAGFVVINIIVSLVVVSLVAFVLSAANDDDSPEAPPPRVVVYTATSQPGILPAQALQGTIFSQQNRINTLESVLSDSDVVLPTEDASNNTIPTLPQGNTVAGVPSLNPTWLQGVTPPSSAIEATTAEEQADTSIISTLEVEDGCERYIVESGDTCTVIAEQLGVDLEALIELNGLNTNCLLQVDQVLRVPGETCQPPPTPTLTPTITNTPFVIGTFAITNTPFPTAENAEVRISQVLNVGDVTTEQVDIQNTGDEVVNLNGWTLGDDDGNVYTFPDFLLQAGGVIRVLSRSAPDTPAALYWNRDTPAWENGDIVTLSDGAGEVQSTFIVGGQPIDFSSEE